MKQISQSLKKRLKFTHWVSLLEPLHPTSFYLKIEGDSWKIVSQTVTAANPMPEMFIYSDSYGCLYTIGNSGDSSITHWTKAHFPLCYSKEENFYSTNTLSLLDHTVPPYSPGVCGTVSAF